MRYRQRHAQSRLLRAPICSSLQVQTMFIRHILASYDGNGVVKIKKTLNVNGQWINQISKGIYSVNADCSGSANYPTAQFSYFVAPTGDSLVFLKIRTRKSESDPWSDMQNNISHHAQRVWEHQLSFSPAPLVAAPAK